MSVSAVEGRSSLSPNRGSAGGTETCGTRHGTGRVNGTAPQQEHPPAPAEPGPGSASAASAVQRQDATSSRSTALSRQANNDWSRAYRGTARSPCRGASHDVDMPRIPSCFHGPFTRSPVRVTPTRWGAGRLVIGGRHNVLVTETRDWMSMSTILSCTWPGSPSGAVAPNCSPTSTGRSSWTSAGSCWVPTAPARRRCCASRPPNCIRPPVSCTCSASASAAPTCSSCARASA